VGDLFGERDLCLEGIASIAFDRFGPDVALVGDSDELGGEAEEAIMGSEAAFEGVVDA
jgi:hypothetical protein